MKKTKLTMKEYIAVASMLFGLFFGAGNLIFPVSMGQQAGSRMLPAAIGFCITGAGLPLLGVAAMGISESKSLFHMSSFVSRGFAYFFTCALYLTIGPLFAIPRTATVSFQVGVAPAVPETMKKLMLAAFSFLFFAAVLFFSLRPSKILTWVGKILNPVFLLFMAVLIVTAFLNPMGSAFQAEASGQYAEHSFFTGFLEGYNTMDALASLAFGIVLIEVIRELGVTDPVRVSACTVKSGVFSTLPMALIYFCLTLLGAQSVRKLGISTDGGTALYQIARHYFGRVGGAFLGVMITFACLKTAIGLVTSCSRAFSEMFPKFCSYKIFAVVFSLFSFAVSNVGLSAIIQFSLPVLMLLYPMTIVLIALCLMGRLFHYRKCVFLCTMTLTILAAVLDMLASLPDTVRNILPFGRHLMGFSQVLPLASLGMGWIIPSLLGFGVGIGIIFFGAKRSVPDTGGSKEN